MSKRLALLLLFVAPLAMADNWLKFPAYKRTVLPNGVTLLIMEKHSAPLISMSVVLKSGSVQDPAGKEGLADVTNTLLRKGAGQRSAQQIAEDLDFIGATLGSNSGFESTQVRSEFLKKDLTTGLDILTDLILRPTFPQDEVDKQLKQRADGLKAAKDNPQGVMGWYYNDFLFGAHPYARPSVGTELSVANIKREDIVRFHEQNYVSGNIIISVCGDFQTAEMEKLLTARFGALPKKSAPAVNVAKPQPVAGMKLLFIDKPDATQTFFRFGNVGIARNDPDRVAVDIINTLFGGRFTSRINTALRIDSGLTYGANSFFDRRRQPGAFVISSYTKNETTGKAIDMALDVLKELHEKGFTEAQLASAKTYIKGQFGPEVETSDQLAAMMADFEIYGLDAKEVDEYAARLDAVTMADAKRVIEKDFPSKNLVFTIVGKGSEVGTLMKKYAPQVETRSIADPGLGKK